MLVFTSIAHSQGALEDYRSGLEHFDKDDCVKAMQKFDTAIAKFEEFAEAYYYRGICHYQTGRIDLAVYDYEKFKKHYKPSNEDAAVSGIFKKPVVDSAFLPVFAKAYLERGKLRATKENYTGALLDYEASIMINQSDPEVFIVHGMALIGQEKYAESLSSFRKACEIKDSLPAVYTGIGIALAALDEHAEAEENFETALSFDSNYHKAYFRLGLLYFDDGDYENAIDFIKKAIEKNGKYPEAYLAYGNCLFKMKRFKEAIKKMDKAVNLKRDYAEAYYCRGDVKFEMGYTRAACADWRQARYLGIKEAAAKIRNHCK